MIGFSSRKSPSGIDLFGVRQKSEAAISEKYQKLTIVIATFSSHLLLIRTFLLSTSKTLFLSLNFVPMF